MAPEGKTKAAFVNLWGRKFPTHEIEENQFKIGDNVYIFAGTNQRKKGIVIKVMPVMMLIKITEGPNSGEVIKCNQSNARITRETEGKTSPVEESQSLALIVQTIDSMKVDYQDSMAQLTHQMLQMKAEHDRKMDTLSGMIRQLALEHTE